MNRNGATAAMTRKEEFMQRAMNFLADEHAEPSDLVDMLLQVEREVWEKVIAGYLRYKESLVPKPGCEKFPMELLMSFEEWCRTRQQELGS